MTDAGLQSAVVQQIMGAEMKKYSLNPIIIEAVQFVNDADCIRTILDWVRSKGYAASFDQDEPGDVYLTLFRDPLVCYANPSDWVCMTQDGTVGTMQDERFRKIYTEVTE